MRLGQSAACAMVLGVLGIITPAQLNAAQDSVINGNFSAGSGNAPDGWRTESWVHEPTTSYAWVGPRNGEAGEVEVSNLEPNDGRWTQSLVLDPGTYFVSAEIRTEGVSRSAGAFISLADEGIASFDITGDSYWQRVGFYLYVSGRPAKVDVKLRPGRLQVPQHRASVLPQCRDPQDRPAAAGHGLLRHSADPRPLAREFRVPGSAARRTGRNYVCRMAALLRSAGDSDVKWNRPGNVSNLGARTVGEHDQRLSHAGDSCVPRFCSTLRTRRRDSRTSNLAL